MSTLASASDSTLPMLDHIRGPWCVFGYRQAEDESLSSQKYRDISEES